MNARDPWFLFVWVHIMVQFFPLNANDTKQNDIRGICILFPFSYSFFLPSIFLAKEEPNIIYTPIGKKC